MNLFSRKKPTKPKKPIQWNKTDIFLIKYWNRFHSLVFVILILGAVAIGAQIWYQGMYGSALTDDERLEYMNKQGAGIVLNESNLNEVASRLKNRKQQQEQPLEPRRNIFK